MIFYPYDQDNLRMSDFKRSFVVPADLVDDLINHIHQYDPAIKESRTYQKLHVEIGHAQLIITNSNIVIFDSSSQIINILREFEQQAAINLHIPQLTRKPEKESTGWPTTPKGVWLQPPQLNRLQFLLQEQGIEKVTPEKHEQARYQKDNQLLVINTNNIVYTIGGFDGFYDLLGRAIESQLEYPTDQKLVAIDEQGRWNRIGPVVLAITHVRSSDLPELRLRGIKDSSLSRDLDYDYFLDVINELCEIETLVIEPLEINQNCTNRNEYLNYLKQRYKDWIIELSIDVTQLIVTSQLQDVISQSSTVIGSERDSLPLALSSLVGNGAIEQWKEEMWHKFGIRLDRSNIENIRHHPEVNTFTKLCLI